MVNQEWNHSHALRHAIVPDLKFHPISDQNQMPSSWAKRSTMVPTAEAKKLDEETCGFTMEEILRGEVSEDAVDEDSKDKHVQ